MKLTNLLIVFVIIVSSIFSTLVMSYIAMASGIGPWIETTLVLFSMLFFIIAARFIALPYVESIGLSTSAGG
ncbi:MAG: hypothetical protein AB7R69_04550, partial [Candidatus Babeliales bacterium]